VGAGFGAANNALFSIPVRGIRAAVDAIDPAASLNVARHNEAEFNGYKKAEKVKTEVKAYTSKSNKRMTSSQRCKFPVPAAQILYLHSEGVTLVDLEKES
jgi:hypothetical protein